MAEKNLIRYRDTLTAAAHFYTGEATHWSQRANRKSWEGHETTKGKSGKNHIKGL